MLAAASPARERSVRIRISCHYWERQVARNALAGRGVGDGASRWRWWSGGNWEAVLGSGDGGVILVRSGLATSAVGMGPWRREAAKCMFRKYPAIYLIPWMDASRDAFRVSRSA